MTLVDFADPFLTGVDEIVVTGPTAPALASLDDLGGKEVFVRPSSSYYESLVRLNETFRVEGKPEITLTQADEYLEDEDLLEMVNGGLLPMVVVDNTKAQFWSQIFDDLEPRPDLAVNTGGEIAWAFRKDSPQLREVVDAFVSTHRQGSLMGNIVLNRYLRSTDWVQNSLTAADMERFKSMVEYFRRYADEYDFDWLMVAAQAYQESRLDQTVRSRVGAVGVMQILPSTAADSSVGIPDIENLENNIHAGVKYLRFMRDRYFANEGLDDLNATLFSFAGYNGGPNRIARLREETAENRPRSQPLVRQRRNGRVETNWPRDGAVCQQHLQVLRRVSSDRGPDPFAKGGLNFDVTSLARQRLCPSSPSITGAELTASQAGRCCDEQEFRALGGLWVYEGAIWGRQIGNPG